MGRTGDRQKRYVYVECGNNEWSTVMFCDVAASIGPIMADGARVHRRATALCRTALNAIVHSCTSAVRRRQLCFALNVAHTTRATAENSVGAIPAEGASSNSGVCIRITCQGNVAVQSMGTVAESYPVREQG